VTSEAFDREVWYRWLNVVWGRYRDGTEHHAYVSWRLLCGRPFAIDMRPDYEPPPLDERCPDCEREARRRTA
jgi:hypothetical protein